MVIPWWMTCSDAMPLKMKIENRKENDGGSLEEDELWKVQHNFEEDRNNDENLVIGRFQLFKNQVYLPVLHESVVFKIREVEQGL